jgi:hypothetical protein
VDFVNAVRRKFKFNNTNMIGKGQFTINMMINDVCGRPVEDRDMIIQGANPPIVCSKKQTNCLILCFVIFRKFLIININMCL